MAGRFTDAVRQELGRLSVDRATVAVELAAVVRLIGVVTRTSGAEDIGIEITTSSGGVARHVHQLLETGFSVRPELLVRSPSGVRATSSYRLRVPSAGRLAVGLGIVDAQGGLRLPVAAEADAAPHAWIRGVVLSAASFSAPGRPPHLEITASSRRVADIVQDVLGRHAQIAAHVTPDRRSQERFRIVCKSGEGIGRLLVVVGASQAFLEWDEHRLRRELRNDANRLANADAANVRRSIETATTQVAEIEDVIARIGWQALDEDLREVGLVRLANPSASLAELGVLCDPPLTKSTVRRRLQRLLERAREGLDESPAGRVGGPLRRP
ncbi:MAG: DNA-binding protein WhiA [Nitriliruptoraceae bacterium]